MERQIQRCEYAELAHDVRRARKRARYDSLDWMGKLELRSRRRLLESAAIWNAAGPNAAALYLIICQRISRSHKESDGDVSPPEVVARLSVWIRAHPDSIDLLSDDDHAANFEAGRWLAEFATFQWLLHMNGKGVAPSTDSLFQEYSTQYPVILRGPRVVYHLDQLARVMSKRRDWAVRFKRKWGAAHARLPAGPCLTEEEILRKVWLLSRRRPISSRRLPRGYIVHGMVAVVAHGCVPR